MPRRIWSFLFLAVVLAVGCIRLGFWQLSRLSQRRARNALVVARFAEPVEPLTRLSPDSLSLLRRASVTGTPDYDHEITLAARSYQGSPGVYLLTPVRVFGSDTAILVNRGWVYAPDGMTVEHQKWRDSITHFVGYAELLPAENARVTGVLVRDSRVARLLDYETVSSLLPYPVSPLYLVATIADSTQPASQRVARLPPPPLDEGPHLSYAIQWFSFAAIALIGGTVVAVGAMRGKRGAGWDAGRLML
jgi:surfeit locus 1 family protein